MTVIMRKLNWHSVFATTLFLGASLFAGSQLLANAQPDAKAAAPTQRKEVLDPSKFYGLASFGYAAAKTCPEVMEKIFCYCGCDLTDSHVSLLDCFTSIHGVDCHICQEEAILARKMHSDGSSIVDIQKAIDEKYARDYPFEQDTPAYKSYKATRYTTGKSAGTASGANSSKAPDNSKPVVAGPEDPDAPLPKLKPGKQMPKCCKADEHKKKTGSKK